jgi:hypothetical protein
MKMLWRGHLYEAAEKYELNGLKGKIKTDIPPEKRSLKNLPRYSTGKAKINFRDWLEMKSGYGSGLGKGCDGKWYGWSHRAVYGFGIGDKIKKGDIAYNGKEYTIETEEQAKHAAERFSDGVS